MTAASVAGQRDVGQHERRRSEDQHPRAGHLRGPARRRLGTSGAKLAGRHEADDSIQDHNLSGWPDGRGGSRASRGVQRAHEQPVVVVVVRATRVQWRVARPALLTGHMTELPLVRTVRIPRTDTYHGVEVTEDYRWLEDASSEETIAWVKAQQQRTRAYFDEIPWRDALRTRVEQLLKAERTTYKRLLSGGSTFFALKVQTPRQQPFLVALADLDDPATERVVVDPEAIDPSGETAIDFFVPSPDGKQVAVSLSEHGTEDGSLYVYDADSGKVVDEPIPHVNLMGGSVAWRHDGSGFWYTRCVDPAGFRQQVWFRELGGAPDHLDLAGGFADERIAENYLSASPDGHWMMDRVQKGDGGEWQVFLRSQRADGSWWQVAGIPDKCVHGVFGTDALYLLSRRDAPHGKVLRLPATYGATVADAREIVPASDLVLSKRRETSGVRRYRAHRRDLHRGQRPPVGVEGAHVLRPAVDVDHPDGVASHRKVFDDRLAGRHDLVGVSDRDTTGHR